MDWSVIRDQKRAFTEPIPDGTRQGLKGAGIDFIAGTAEFKDASTLMVNGAPVRGKYIVLATGAQKPRVVPVPGKERLITALDFLGFGLPPPTPSLGELLKQGTANLRTAPWIVMSAFGTLVALLTLVTFIGEAVRESFDPKTYSVYR